MRRLASMIDWPWRALALLTLLLCGPCPPLRAQAVRPVPPLSGRVVDQTGTLSAAQAEAMATKLAALEREHGAQMVVLIVPTVQPEDIAAYAQRVGEAWKIGRRQVGDGLLIVVAKNDHKVRIEVAKGLEGAVPDLAADRIIRASVTPAFKAGDYAGGLNLAIDGLGARIRADGSPHSAPASTSGPEATVPAASAPEVPGTEAQIDAAANADADAERERAGRASDIGAGIAIFTVVLGLAVLVAGVTVTVMIGRKLGALGTGGLTGVLGGYFTSSVALGITFGLVALVLVALFGRGSRGTSSSAASRSPSRRVRDNDSGGGIVWGGSSSSSDSSSSSSSNSGFSSGGGGDFGGGGASGDW